MMNARRSLCRYGLALLMIAGAALLTATSPSGASEDPPLKQDFDCWLATNRYCNLTYFPQCWQKPDGYSCYTCPLTFYGAASCVRRPSYACQPSEDLPFDCGPKQIGYCVGGACVGDLPGVEICKILQCTSISS